MASLFVIKGANQGVRFDLEAGVVGLGRDATNLLQLHDSEISRRHAEVRRQGKNFILADLGIGLGLLSDTARDLILGASILSIFLNPLIFAVVDKLLARDEAKSAPGAEPVAKAREPLPVTTLSDHIVLVGYGRVGGVVGTPTSILIDRRGRIVKRYLGEPDWAEFHALVERALAEPA